jgi:DNA polymerase
VSTEELEARAELSFLASALRAHLEWQAACGAVSLPLAQPAADGAVVGVPAPVTGGTGGTAPAADLAAARSSSALEPRVVDSATQHRLSVLRDEIAACTRCGLHAARTQTVFARGSGASGLCFVGEGPGADEDAQGLPFVGAAGQLLDKMIGAMGFERDEVYVCNIVKCRPPKNRAPEPDEMAACMPYLVEQLELVGPQVIVALGKTAVQGLFGSVESITKIRGRWRLYKGKIAVMPTFHPAYLLRTPAAKREVWADLQAVLKHLGRAVPARS